MKYIFLLGLVLVCLGVSAQTKKLLIIGIDGCRGDAIQVAKTPTLDKLRKTGFATLDARTMYPTMSGPGWSSMLTGVWFTKHGVRGNVFLGRKFEKFPHFYNHIEAANPELYTVSVCHWSPINDKIIDKVDYKKNLGTDIEVEKEAVRVLSKENPDALFLHFDDVDHAGHFTGFGPHKPNYVSKIEKVDGHIAKVLEALENRPTFDQEDWLIIVSTDHGGKGNSHGGRTLIERTTFQIYNGKNVQLADFEGETVAFECPIALNFNGEDACISVPKDAQFKFGEATDFTVECWVRTNGWKGDPAIVSDKNWKNGKNKGFIIAAHSDGERWKINLGDGSNRIDLEGDKINDGEWHYLALSVDRDGLVRMFQDGRLLGVEKMDLEDLSSDYGIGIAQDGTLKYGDYFKGSIKDVRIWSAALSQEVLTDWASSKISKSHPNFGAMLAYWPLDEKQGIIVKNHLGGMTGIHKGKVSRILPRRIKWTSKQKMPMMVDIVPTALDHLGIELKKEWDLDGRSLLKK